MKCPFFFIAFLLMNPLLFSQEVFFFAGKVVDAHTGDLLEKATLEVNGKAHALDVFAAFSIYAETGDTIVFSHLGYQSFRFLLVDTMSSASLPQTISLHREIITLDEVEVNNYELTEAMKRNAQRNVQIMRQQAQGKGTKDIEGNYKVPLPSGSGLSSEQMFGVNIVALLARLKFFNKKPPDLPSKKMVPYEEYKSTLEPPSTPDSILLK